MGKTVIKEDMFPELVELYNREGKAAVYEILRSQYGMKHPYFVLKRLKASAKYLYDSDADRFTVKDILTSEDVFLDLDELCSGAVVEQRHSDAISRTEIREEALKKLVNELINDRLLTLSRYITLDNASRTILIDQTSLSQDGYRIISH